MAKRKIKAATKNDATAYIAKAEQFLETMELAIEAGQWDSAGLQAVHSVISTSDALLAFYGGVRSVEQDHRAVAGLIQDIFGPDANTAIRHVRQAIQKKNLVEYEQRRLTEKEARDIAGHARRYMIWALKLLPSK
jgi:HEPN domain-containing protein